MTSMPPPLDYIKLQKHAREWGRYDEVELSLAVERLWIGYQLARDKRPGLKLDEWILSEQKRPSPWQIKPSTAK